MARGEALSPEQLRPQCDPAGFEFESTGELAPLDAPVGQSRALTALEFGVGMQQSGYNLYALGPSGLGKQTLIRQYLDQQAAEGPAPDDWCYVNNFEDPNKPCAIRLPAGQGAAFRRDMGQLVEELLTAIPAAFESDEYQNRRSEIEQELKERQENAFSGLRDEAEESEIALMHTPGGFAFAPMRNGEVLGPDEFEKLPESQRKDIEQVVSRLQERLQDILRQIPVWRKEAQKKLRELNQETAAFAVGHSIDELKAQYAAFPRIQAHLDAVRDDIVDNVDDFRRHAEGQEQQQTLMMMRGEADPFRRYQVNLLVEHEPTDGAPVLYEDHPIHDTLIGRVEHQARMGALMTDFNLIRPGVLHRANGGYLLIDAAKVLLQPGSWDALKRALTAGEIRIRSLGEMYSLISTTSLEPEPIPLDVKVILLGERLLYYLLCEYDREFRELFKVAVDFEEQVERGPEQLRLYARLIATVVQRDSLRAFDRTGVAAVIEQAARSLGDSERLSTHMGELADLLREADYWCGRAGHECVTETDVRQAISQQIYRSDRVRERIQEEIERGTLLIDSDGRRVGQINGLSVLDLGTFAFGRPSRITATARLGEGNVTDVEREVELGGKIHSKGVLILSNFLAARYCKDYPLSVQASVVFEQSYSGVEGDSASVAEMCALLSALADIPLRQDLAVTGSVNQHGQVQPIGGVNQKIEGFYDVCHARGLNGTQGVVIPATNVKHLMLREDVVEAAQEGRFAVYPVETIDDVMALYTGMEPGERDASGRFPEGTINYSVDVQLRRFALLRREFGKAGGDGEKGVD